VWGILVSDLLKKDGVAIENSLKELASQVGVEVPPEAPEAFRAVTWGQVREMHVAGMEIGGHTVNHYSLGRLNREMVREELKGCHKRLTAELGAEPKAFCYPNGQPYDVPSDYAEVLKEAGFESGVVAYYDRVGMRDRWALRRHGIGDGWYDFQKTIRGVDRLGAVLLGRNNVFDWGEA